MISTAQNAQYTSCTPRKRSHNAPHRSQYFSSNWVTSGSSTSIMASNANTSRGSLVLTVGPRRQANPIALLLGPMAEGNDQNKKPRSDCPAKGPLLLRSTLLII